MSGMKAGIVPWACLGHGCFDDIQAERGCKRCVSGNVSQISLRHKIHRIFSLSVCFVCDAVVFRFYVVYHFFSFTIFYGRLIWIGAF